VFINGVRWHVLEKFLFSRALPEPESEDWKKRKDHADTLVHLQESQYRFFQFYGNTAVALVPALVVAAVSLWDGGRGGALVALLALFLGIEAILLSCALSCYRKYMIRRASLIGTDVA
jgi:hypothetical protein